MRRCALILMVLSLALPRSEGKTPKPKAVQPPEVLSGDVVVVEKDKVIQGDVQINGNRVVIAGTVLGNVTLGTHHAELTGKILGSLKAGVETLSLRGELGGDLEASGVGVTITGQVGGKATLHTLNVWVSKDARISGDLVCYGESLDIVGRVGGSVMASVGRFKLDGTVDGSVDASKASQVTVGDSARVTGIFKAPASAQTRISPKAHINLEKPPKAPHPKP